MKGRQIIIRPPESFQSKWKYQREEGEKKTRRGKVAEMKARTHIFVISSLWFPNALPERAILSSKLRIIQQ